MCSSDLDFEVAKSLLTRMCDKYPISLAKVWVEPNDTDEGVKIMRAQHSKSTARVFSRKNSLGKESSYYEYRDTVMSRTSTFRPEWIKPIRIVNNDAPDNPDVAYNKGHLMHQCTFFIGEVNFYWEIDSTKYSEQIKSNFYSVLLNICPQSFEPI